MTGVYLRRGVPWPSVAACAALATVLAVVARQWPTTAGAVLPLLLAATGAAAAFAFDEPVAVVADVTPRAGRWAVLVRYAVVAGVAVLAGGLVVWVPLASRGPVGGWLLVAAVSTLGGAGVAGTLRHLGTSRPGQAVATLLLLGAAGLLVVGPLAGLTQPWPLPDAPGGVHATWWLLAVLAVVAAARRLVRG